MTTTPTSPDTFDFVLKHDVQIWSLAPYLTVPVLFSPFFIQGNERGGCEGKRVKKNHGEDGSLMQACQVSASAYGYLSVLSKDSRAPPPSPRHQLVSVVVGTQHYA